MSLSAAWPIRIDGPQASYKAFSALFPLFSCVHKSSNLRFFFLLLGLPFASALPQGGGSGRSAGLLPCCSLSCSLACPLLCCCRRHLYIGVLFRGFSFSLVLPPGPLSLPASLSCLVAEVRDCGSTTSTVECCKTVWFSGWSASHRFQR